MTTTTRQTIELPVAPNGDTHTFYLGSMTPEQAATFAAIPGPGEYYSAHRDETLKDGGRSSFTLLLNTTDGRLQVVTVRPDGSRSR